MEGFLRCAEEILAAGTTFEEACNTAILIDRAGCIRVLNADGWSLHALAVESGADAIFRLQRAASAVRVEAWDGAQRCLIERVPQRNLLGSLPGSPVIKNLAIAAPVA